MRMTPAEQRRLAVASSGVLLSKTLHLSGEVYLAMQARGFRGEVYLLDDFQMRSLDWLALAGFRALASVVHLGGPMMLFETRTASPTATKASRRSTI